MLKDRVVSAAVRPWLQAAVLIVGLLLFAAWWSGLPEAAPTTSLLPSLAAQHAEQVKTQYTIELSEYRFTPDHLTVPQGARVKLVLINRGRQTHEFELSGYALEIADIQPGQQVTLAFTASQVGQFSIACRLPGHFERGMRAILTVRRP